MMVNNAITPAKKNGDTSSLFSFDDQEIHRDLSSVLEREAQAILAVTRKLPEQAVFLVKDIVKASGRVVFSGMGKSGHIARKLVATFSSMGTPAMFLHPSEALHGDLGMVAPNDYFIALSKSGTGKELEQVITSLQVQGNKTALICCRSGVLTTLVDTIIRLPFEREACDLNLAPTSSSTLMIAFGDAVSVAVSKIIGFEKKDFAKSHPAGALGKQLLAKVQNFMYTGDELPFISENASFKDLLFITTSKKLGVAIVVDSEKNLQGIITDGDLRRACEFGASLFEKTAADIMMCNPKTTTAQTKAYDALIMMEQFNITSLVVTEGTDVVGLVHIHDLIKAGIKA